MYIRVHDWHNDGVFIKATKSLKIVVLTCYLSHSPKIHRKVPSRTLKTENLAINKEKCCHEKYPLLEYDWHNDVLHFEGYNNKKLVLWYIELTGS